MENADKPINPIQNSEGFPSSETVIDRDDLLIGLTKREHFAGLAMQAIVSGNYTEHYGEKWTENIVKDSIRLADELLKQLEETK